MGTSSELICYLVFAKIPKKGVRLMSDRDQDRKRDRQDTSSRTLNKHSTVHTQQIWNNSTVVGSQSYPPNTFDEEPSQEEAFWLSKIFVNAVCYIVSAVLFFFVFRSQLLDTGSEEELKYLAIYLVSTIITGYVLSILFGTIIIKKKTKKAINRTK